MKRKFRKGDQVIVTAGNDQGKVGKILAFRGEDRVVIEGINVRKKHIKKSQSHPKGQIIDLECSIHLSNIQAAVDDKPVKLKRRINEKGEKELYYFDANQKPCAFRTLKKS